MNVNLLVLLLEFTRPMGFYPMYPFLKVILHLKAHPVPPAVPHRALDLTGLVQIPLFAAKVQIHLDRLQYAGIDYQI